MKHHSTLRTKRSNFPTAEPFTFNSGITLFKHPRKHIISDYQRLLNHMSKAFNNIANKLNGKELKSSYHNFRKIADIINTSGDLEIVCSKWCVAFNIVYNVFPKTKRLFNIMLTTLILIFDIGRNFQLR